MLFPMVQDKRGTSPQRDQLRREASGICERSPMFPEGEFAPTNWAPRVCSVLITGGDVAHYYTSHVEHGSSTTHDSLRRRSSPGFELVGRE